MIRKNRNLIWGFVLILIACAALAIAFDLITGNLTKMIWGLLLGAVALGNLFSLSWGGVFFPIAIIAHIYRTELGIQSVWVLYFAALLLTSGFYMVTRGFRRKKHRGFTVNINGENVHPKDIKHKIKDSLGGLGSNYSEGQDGEIVNIENNFGEASKYVNSTNLKIATVENNFGHLRVYFDNAKFSDGGAVIKTECNFGKITLYLPRDINIVNNLSATLGSVTGEGPRIVDETCPKVVLEGDANFGNIDIVLI